MSLQFVIDGYNLIHHPSFSNFHHRKDCRLALLEFIRKQRLCGSLKNKAVVVFDGYPAGLMPIANNAYGIDVIFAQGQTADERIKKIVEESPNPRNIAVVSDDKEIKFFIKSLGAIHIGIEEFTAGKERPITAKGDFLKAELNYSQAARINKELRQIWLKD